MPDKAPAEKQKKSRMQARGKARREEMLNAALELLAERDPEQITFKDIYERAGLLPGSAYRFFENLEDIVRVLKERTIHDFANALSKPFAKNEITTWQDLSDKLVRRGGHYYKNPAASKILAVTSLPMGMIGKGDRKIGNSLEQIFLRYFNLPQIPNRGDVFLIYSRIATQIYAMSIYSHGRVTDELLAEAQAACKGYLAMYLPGKLPKADGTAEPEPLVQEEGGLFPANFSLDEKT